MSVPTASTFPTTNDTFPTVSGTDTLSAAEHSKLHNLTFSSLSAIQVHLGRSATYTQTGDLSWDTSAITTLNKVALAFKNLRTLVGSSGDSSAASTVYGAIALVQSRVGLTSDATTATTAHGKINKINANIGTSADAYNVATVYGAIANAKKISADAIGTTADSSSLNTVYGNIAKKLNASGGTVSGALTVSGLFTANGGARFPLELSKSEAFAVSTNGTDAFRIDGTGTQFIANPIVPAATSGTHAVNKAQLDTGLAAKADTPGTGQAMLRFTAGQSANAVTVWIGNDPNVLTSNPPVLDGNHANGSNVQLQWNAGTQKLRYHIDARTGVAGQNGVVGAGAVYRDLAPVGVNKPDAWTAANNAVMSHGLNDIGLRWLSSKVYLAVDNTQIGSLAFEAPSSGRFKTIDNSVVPDYRGFLDAVNVVRFQYTDDPAVGSLLSGQTHLGFIAENVQQAAALNNIPDDVVVYDDQDRVAGISDRDMLAVLWRVVQDIARNTPAS